MRRVADWFAQLNNKMGGDLKKIQTVGEYFVEVWKAVGMEDIGDKVHTLANRWAMLPAAQSFRPALRPLNIVQVLFLSASEEINKSADKYWTSVMDIARRNNLNRIIRCSQIMGRTDTDDLSAAQILYPCMQCADIFYLQVCTQSSIRLPQPSMLSPAQHSSMQPSSKQRTAAVSWLAAFAHPWGLENRSLQQDAWGRPLHNLVTACHACPALDTHGLAAITIPCRPG